MELFTENASVNDVNEMQYLNSTIFQVDAMFDFLPRNDSSSDQTAPTAFKVSNDLFICFFFVCYSYKILLKEHFIKELKSFYFTLFYL